MNVSTDRASEPELSEPREPSGDESPRPHEGGRPPRPATDSIADGVRSRTTYAVSLDMFEGPLDLLLHLVRRHELDILDIPIAFVTEKYIEYISFARSLDIEIAGEYLLMAATLAFLKSRELLPAAPSEDEESEDEEDGVDPREELIRRLIEYERFRNAGDELGSRPLFGRDVFPRGGDPDVILPEPGLAPVTLFRLAEAYNRVLDRAKIREEHEVVIEPVTVRQRMRQLGLMLSREPKISFEGLFLSRSWANERELRQMLVVTLMSVLEMCKIGVLGVYQAHGSETLELERVVDVEEMTAAISVFREEGEEDEPVDDDAELAAEPGLAPAVEAGEPTGDAPAVEAGEPIGDEPPGEPPTIEVAPAEVEVATELDAREVEPGELPPAVEIEPEQLDAASEAAEVAAELEVAAVEVAAVEVEVGASVDVEPIPSEPALEVVVEPAPEAVEPEQVEAEVVEPEAEQVEAEVVEPEAEQVEAEAVEPEAVEVEAVEPQPQVEQVEAEAVEAEAVEPEVVEPEPESEPAQTEVAPERDELAPDPGETE